MSKNKFGIPGIVFEASPSPTGVIGGGTAQDGLGNNDLPMNFNAWATHPDNLWQFYDQQNDKGTSGQPDMYDYGMWFADCDYSLAQWKALGYSEEDFGIYVVPYQW
ncbi:MAG: hypothetical protein IKO51_00405 [Clostridia bacterium]|nr:hypothetical protein [Clostridia bacterium]